MSTMPVVDNQARILERAGGVWFDFEQLIVEIYKEVSRPDDCIFDVGANRGDHTFQMARCVMPHGHVYAVEAVSDIAQRLQTQCNGLYADLSSVVHILNVGAYDSTGTAKFFSVPDQTGLGSLRNRSNVADQKLEINVKLAKLDEVIPRIKSRLSFMKFDVEGAELFAMRGAIGHIKRHHPVIVFEFDKDSAAAFDYSAADMLQMLHDLKYEVFDFFGGRMQTRAEFENSRVWNYIAFRKQPKLRREVFQRLENFIAELLKPS